MRFLLPLLAFAGLAAAAPAEKLTLANYKARTAETPQALIYFTASYCSDCDSLGRLLQEAADELEKEGLSFPLFYADIGEDEDLKEVAGVRGVPSVSIIRHGERSNYRGLRARAAQVVHYLQTQAGPAVRELTALEDAKKWEANPDTLHLVVAVTGASDEDKAAQASFQSFAEETREDFVYFLVDRASAGPGLLEHYGLDKAEGFAVSVFQSWAPEDHAVASGEDVRSREQIEEHVRAHSFPEFPLISKGFMKFLVGYGKPIARVVLDVENIDDRYYKVKEGDEATAEKLSIINGVRKQKEFEGKVTWAVAARDSHDYMMRPMGYADQDVIFVNKFGESNKYVFDYSWSGDLIYTWMLDWSQGRLRPWIKSAPAPANPVDENGVTTLVASTLEDVVFDDTKDVLVEFYAPWCGHCKKLAPIWDQLGRTFINNDNVVIAKVDATSAGDIDKDKFPVTGYPTLLFSAAGRRNRKLDKYRYERSFDVISSYLVQMQGSSPKWEISEEDKQRALAGEAPKVEKKKKGKKKGKKGKKGKKKKKKAKKSKDEL